MYTTFSGNRQQIFVLSSVSRINSHVLGGEVQIHLEYVIDLTTFINLKKQPPWQHFNASKIII